jgi:flagella basal body P-ring formation protein FlgA
MKTRTLIFALACAIASPVITSPVLANPASGAPAQSAVDAANAVRIVVPTRNIARGETIDEADLQYTTIDNANTRSDLVMAMNNLAGKQARRFLRAGEPVRESDVRQPILVTKGSTVTIVFMAPGVSLTASGKAMSEGGLGESVVVLNPVSYRQITGIVTAAGTVRAGSVDQSAALPVSFNTAQN